MIILINKIVIDSVGIYHPENVIENKYYIDYFKKQGKDIREILKTSGRNKRYISLDENENCITMSVNAANAALDRAKISADMLDMLVFSSGTPEYLAPPNSVKIHYAIKGSTSAIVYDMNCNCVGMIVAIEQICRYMQQNESIKYAMVVGAEQFNKYCKDDDEITKSAFGDAACAVILKKVQNTDSGFVDSVYYTDSSRSKIMLFPECGMSNIYNKDIEESKKRVLWTGGNAGNGFKLSQKLIESVINKNNLKKSDISKYFISQVDKKNVEDLCNAMNERIQKFEFVGDRFGYTGTSSPFLALNNAIEKNEIRRGDYIIFWSVGTGYVSSAMLFRY